MNLLSDFLRKNGPEAMALCTGGLPSFLWQRHPEPIAAGLPVFCHHLPEPEVLEQDLDFLARNGYRTLSADDLLGHLQRERIQSGSALVLSFDDGSIEFYRTAFPLLRSYGCRAVLFIAPGLHRARVEEPLDACRPCTWEELEEMNASGLVDIQSHTWDHRSLTNWPRPLPLTGIDEAGVASRRTGGDSMPDNLRRAREVLEERLGKTVRHLAFPCYRASEAAGQAACAAGYEALWAGTLPRRPLNAPGQSPLRIARLSADFIRRLPGNGRTPLGALLRRRYAAAVRRHVAPRTRKDL